MAMWARLSEAIARVYLSKYIRCDPDGGTVRYSESTEIHRHGLLVEDLLGSKTISEWWTLSACFSITSEFASTETILPLKDGFARLVLSRRGHS